MRFYQTQSEKHIPYGGKPQPDSEDYQARKGRTEELFKFWQGIVLWSVLLAGSFFLFFVIHYQGPAGEEALRIATRGRAIAFGQPDSHPLFRPVYLEEGGSFGAYSGERIAPLYPRIQAFAFRIGGFDDVSTVIAGSLFFLAASLLTYRLASRILPKNAALLVFFLTFTSPVLLRSAINGLPTAFLVFLVVLIFYGREALPPRVSAGFSGLILGAAFLAEYSSLFYLPVFLLFLLVTTRERRERWVGAGIFLAGLSAVLVPWMIGEAVSGRGSLARYLAYHWRSGTALLPGRTADGLFGIPLDSFTLPFPLVVGKLHQGVSIIYREALAVSGNFVGLFFWGSLFSRTAAGREKHRRLLCLLLLAAGGAWMVLFQPRPELLAPLVPLVILYGTEFFFTLQERFGPRKKSAARMVIAGFLIVNCLPVFFGRSAPDPDRQDMINSFEYLRSLVREEEMVLTDIPELVNWYGNRTAVRIPLNPAMARDMLRDYPEPVFLLLSPRLAERRDLDPTGQWWRLYNQRNWPDPGRFDQAMLIPGRLVFMGNKTLLLNRISARW